MVLYKIVTLIAIERTHGMKKANLIRDKGTGMALVFLSFCSFVIICLIFILVNQTSNLEIWQDIENSAHKTLLQMEADGKLTDEEQAILTRELQEIGVTDISFQGTTIDTEEYGETIYLTISGSVTLFSNPFEDGTLYEEKAFTIEKQITSKALEGIE